MTPRRFQGRSSGFTLVEMLVAVGAVGLIAVGLAGLFQRTGDTVRAGRRLAYLNEVATMVERGMREDIENISRDGFLVIKHRYVPVENDDRQPAAVALNAEDRLPRARRIDELMFFRTGRFTSQREPTHPSRDAVGRAARVWYGHGLPQTRDLSANPDAFVPFPDDLNDGTRPARASSFGTDGPSKYASSWILMRHQTALIPPRLTADADPPANVTFPNAGRWGDSRFQIALQPSAYDVFRIFSEYARASEFPGDGAPRETELVRSVGQLNEGARLPKFTSGIVDIASTDLSQIRARVLNAQPIAYQAQARAASQRHLERIRERSTLSTAASGTTQPAPFALERLDLSLRNPYQRREAAEPGEPPSFPPQHPGALNDPITQVSPVPTASRMKAWMLDAMPADPLPDDRPDRERRVRCEPSSPDLLGTISQGRVWDDQEPWRRTDQYMLSASNLVVGCTEFIVEWSYGKTYPRAGQPGAPTGDQESLRGQLVWHGLERVVDVNGDFVFAAHPYTSAVPYQREEFAGYDAALNGERWYPRGFSNLQAPSNDTPRHVFESALIHEPGPGTSGEWNYPEQPTTPSGIETRLFSIFGYVDPTFGNIASGATTNNGTARVGRAGEPEYAPVPWPKLIRVTMSLVDASDPLREQTFQFVFKVPEPSEQRPEF